MVNQCWSRLRLTHLPTGHSVVVRTRTRCGRPGPAEDAVARRWLASLVAHAPEPTRPVRSYVLDPTPLIRQGMARLATGAEEVAAILDGWRLPPDANNSRP